MAPAAPSALAGAGVCEAGVPPFETPDLASIGVGVMAIVPPMRRATSVQPRFMASSPFFSDRLVRASAGRGGHGGAHRLRPARPGLLAPAAGGGGLEAPLRLPAGGDLVQITEHPA